MRSQEIRQSFKKAYESYDMYGDRIVSYVNQDPVRMWLTYKDIVHFSQMDIEGLKYDLIGICRDQRPEKGDLIDDKLIVYKLEVNRWCYYFLQELKGDDDE